jgi:hypothetical protein
MLNFKKIKIFNFKSLRLKNFPLVWGFFLLNPNLLPENLKSGDVLLLSLNCYECRMIESETNSAYSHSGVVIRDEKNNLQIAQALGEVHLTTLQNFARNITAGTEVSVFRPQKNIFQDNPQNILRTFRTDFAGASFDPDFLWTNNDIFGNETYYCAEFVAKFINRFLSQPLLPRPMSFAKNKDYWQKHFGDHPPPEGELGVSPVDFSTTEVLEFVGTVRVH